MKKEEKEKKGEEGGRRKVSGDNYSILLLNVGMKEGKLNGAERLDFVAGVIVSGGKRVELGRF